jgi:transposase
MAHQFRPYAPEQPFLLPPDPREWLSEDHLAYCIRDVVQQLDLAPFLAGYSRDGRGAPPYAPQLLVSLLLYGWCQHVYSSRQIERLCTDDLGGRFLAAGHRPDHRCLSDFRLRHGEALRGLFLASLRLCQAAGMVSLGHVALDGSKVAANASKHKAMSYGRLVEAEAHLATEVEAMLTRAAQVDAAEDQTEGKEPHGSPLGEELARRQSRLSKLREAKAALEAEARAAAQAATERRAAEDAQRQAAGQPKKGGRKLLAPDQVRPKDKAQRNFTDPESRIMKGGDGAWVQGYNAQAAVDRDEQVIVAGDLTAQAADAPHLPAMTAQVVANTGCKPDGVSADPGYFSAGNITQLEQQGIRALIPPDRERHGSPAAPAAPLPPEVLAGLTVAERQRHVLSTAAGRAEYRYRKTTVEPVFGQIKGCPAAPGFRGFLRRGLAKCQQEWNWVCAAHNFSKYFRFCRRRAGTRERSAPLRPVGRAVALT